MPVGPVKGLELPPGFVRHVKEAGGDRILQNSDGTHCFNEINKQISKGLHSFYIFHRKSEQIFSDLSWSSQQVSKWPWKFFLMNSNHKTLIKWVSMDFGLCLKRGRDGCMVVCFNNGMKRRILVLLDIYSPPQYYNNLEVKKLTRTTDWMHWHVKNSIGFMFQVYILSNYAA